MYKLYFDETKEVIYQVDPQGKKTIIADNFPSEPIFSPDNTKAIYISPLEWECPGSLYLYNLETGYISELVAPDEETNIPKYALWIDDENIALIIGFGWGTVCVGGNLYTYNLTSQELKQITFFSQIIQITKFELQGELIKLKGIKYIDDNYNEFEEYKDQVFLEKK